MRKYLSRRHWLVVAASTGMMLSAALVGSAGALAQSASSSLPADADTDGTLRVGFPLSSGDGTITDPIKYNGQGLALTAYMQLIYGTMIQETAAGVSAGFATKWEAPDDKTVDLTLRDGLTFQDGTPFDAAAVKTSWDRVINSKSMFKTVEIKSMQSVEVLAPNKVRLHLSLPQAVGLLARHLRDAVQLGVSSPAALKAQGDNYTQPVGAGPYKLVEYVPNQRVVLEKWDGYWDAASFPMKRIEFINVDPGAAQVTALASDTVDVAPVEVGSAVAAKQLGFDITETPASGTFALSVCRARPPFESLAARQALSLAIDRKALAATQTGGYATPETLIINSHAGAEFLNNRANDVADSVVYDLDRAQQLAKEAGIAPGTAITMLYHDNPDSQAAAEELKRQLSKIGLDVTLRSTVNQSQDISVLKPDLYLSRGSDPRVIPNDVFPGSGGNLCNLTSPELVDLWNAAHAPGATPEQLKDAWHKLQEFWVSDEVTVPVYGGPLLLAHTSKVHGLSYRFMALGIDFRGVYLTH